MPVYYSIAIPGCTWEGPVLLGIPGMLGQGYACVLFYSHPGMSLGRSCVTRESWDTRTRGMPMYYSIAIPGCT